MGVIINNLQVFLIYYYCYKIIKVFDFITTCSTSQEVLISFLGRIYHFIAIIKMLENYFTIINVME